MSVLTDMKGMGPETEVWMVRTAIFYYFRGAELALRRLGDADHSEFRSFAYGYLDIRRADEIPAAPPSNAPDYRGLICCVMDDLGIRDRDQRDRILDALTGVKRQEP